MRLGIVTDIHEDVDALRWALDVLRGADAERIISLGDVAEDGVALGETCRLLKDAGVVGVWGNHDFGLCTTPDDRLRELLGERYDEDTLAYMRSLEPRMRLEGCHFTHLEPCFDPHSGLDLWMEPVLPETQEQLARNWAASSERWMFMGHMHQWFAASSTGVLDWNGRGPLMASGNGERYLVIVHAVCRGSCALFDTSTGRLDPFTRDRAT